MREDCDCRKSQKNKTKQNKNKNSLKFGGNLMFLAFFFFFFPWATPTAYGSSQTRDGIRAVAASLHHSHSNARSELLLQPTLQLMATPDPSPTD